MLSSTTRNQLTTVQKIDKVLININYLKTVIPAKAGIQLHLDSRLRGNDECVT